MATHCLDPHKIQAITKEEVSSEDPKMSIRPGKLDQLVHLYERGDPPTPKMEKCEPSPKKHELDRAFRAHQTHRLIDGGRSPPKEASEGRSFIAGRMSCCSIFLCFRPRCLR